MSKPQPFLDLWPVHLKPKDDELLSSWLVRLAIAHGIKLHTFCSLTWSGKQIWNRDIDKSADKEIVEALSTKTGTPLERVRATTLSAYENILYERHNHFGPTSWIMPIGVYHRKRRQFGLQYCPLCLAEDKEPYYRRKWRLAFIIMCERHRIVLSDRCPKCKEPINFHRAELGNYRKLVADSLTLCYACRFDVKAVGNQIFLPTKADETEFTTTLLQAMDAGFIRLGEDLVIYSHLFFAGLRQLMKILAMTDKRISYLRQAISRTYNVEVYTPSVGGSTDVQELGIEARRCLLRATRCLLEEWPRRFIEFSRKFKIWSSVWLRHFDPPPKERIVASPFWFLSVVHENLYRSKYCPSEEEVKTAIEYLKRTGNKVNKSTVARLLGVAVLRKEVML